MLRKWEDLPDSMKNESVRKYYDLLYKRRLGLFAKRVFDIVIAFLTLIILSPAFLIISVAIRLDSKGPIMFRQVRVTRYEKQFKIFKFRTMVNNANQNGSLVTTKNDHRVTRIGKILRTSKLDEIPQLINIILGDMTFVGTRPEVVKYVERYSDDMIATLLLPAGITSEASILYKDEEQLFKTEDADQKYVNDVLPEKMRYNLKSIEEFSFFRDIKTLIKTVFAVVNSGKSIEKTNEGVSTDDKNEVKIQ